MARPLTPVTAPFAEPPRFGLLASNPPVTGQGERWVGGIRYDPEGCSNGEIFGTCDYGTEVVSVDNPAWVEWWPYILSVTTQCSTLGGYEDAQPRARRLMEQQTETLLGNELWTGTFSATETDNPNTPLASAGAEVLDTAADLSHGLACLEQYLADNNGGKQGMIHAPVQLVTHWESFRLLRREGNKILTFKDTIIVPSPGYNGTSPTGTVGDGDIWAYATDMIRVWLTEPSVSPPVEGTDRLDNTVYVTAQRYALAEWELCRHAGVSFDMEVCGSY